MSCWQQSKLEREKLSPDALEQCPCFDDNLFQRCRFPGVRKEYHPAVDEPEPPQPPEPGDPPPLPNSVLGFDQAYRDRVEEYNQRVKDYQTAMDRWQDQFALWKEQRGRRSPVVKPSLIAFGVCKGTPSTPMLPPITCA